MIGWERETVRAWRLEPGVTYRAADGWEFTPTRVELRGRDIVVTVDGDELALHPEHTYRRIGSHPLRREALAYTATALSNLRSPDPLWRALGREQWAAGADRWNQISRDYRSRLLDRKRELQPTGDLRGVTLFDLERSTSRA